MIKIRVHLFNESISKQVFDRYYAYRQSLNRKQGYCSDVVIEFGEPVSDAINIALAYMPRRPFCNLDLYDLILVDNAGESLEVATPYIKQSLSNEKVYFLCGAFLEKSHLLYEKSIPFNHNIRLLHDTMTRGFYPQYFERAVVEVPQRDDICYVNGSNRSNRQYMMDLITTVGIPTRSKLTSGVVELPESQFEEPQDSEFRDFVNSLYNTQYHSTNYYNNNIMIGINNSYGQIPPGYFMIDEYYNYKCVVFPETHWTNYQHFMTEKIFKCFVSGALPWPIAGARTHAMYNQLGYKTAWNLLPSEHQTFDNIADHKIRYQKIAQALLWLKQNPEVMNSSQAHDIIKQNKLNFFVNTIDIITVTRLHQVLSTVYKFNDTI